MMNIRNSALRCVSNCTAKVSVEENAHFVNNLMICVCLPIPFLDFEHLPKKKENCSYTAEKSAFPRIYIEYSYSCRQH